jgi:hypothetical protein
VLVAIATLAAMVIIVIVIVIVIVIIISTTSGWLDSADRWILNRSISKR